MAITAIPDELRSRLTAFDGKAVSILSEIAVSFEKTPDLMRGLITLTGDSDPMIQRGASWIVLDRMKAGIPLSQPNWRKLTEMLDKITDWMAVLHVLQSLEQQDPPKNCAPPLARFSARYLDHPRAFLRAWAMSAIHTLSTQDQTLTIQAKRAVAAGLEDPGASVRARARKLNQIRKSAS